MKPVNVRQQYPSPLDELTPVSPASLIDPEIASILVREGQTHLLKHLECLDENQRGPLLNSLRSIHWADLDNIYQTPELPRIGPSDVISLKEAGAIRAQIEELGSKAYARGEVGILIVAGGDGTRLGFPQPKGCYPFGPESSITIYEILLSRVRDILDDCGCSAPLAVMTSASTHTHTEGFVRSNNYFGLDPNKVRFFQQTTVPTTDENGLLLLKNATHLLENPTGHGGCLDALNRSGTLEWFAGNGIKDLVYLHVDNVLAPMFDPFAVGLRRSRDMDLVTKVLKKLSPEEKMGSLVKVDGRDTIVEYSDLSPEQKIKRLEDGSLLFGWGNIGGHVISVNFLKDLHAKGVSLPYHCAQKKVTTWVDGEAVQQIGVKREKFIFDMLPLARNIGLEVVRQTEFAPVKNKSGLDSVETAQKLYSAEHKRWLEEAGVQVRLVDDQMVEISPNVATTCKGFLRAAAVRRDLPRSITGSYFLE